ncbi:putative major facilitator superfamily transporter [Nocardia brasiliensis NBRC 14402]|uniref:MFS transporter n=1 Tax=Nocardia brasiliensis TaxID=37326 RepID=UPI00045D3E36|nr:MFS transporter [Nocardia brasiliensis]ASF12347.1 MFS transporter [Nocardia brasiliensis]GAJ85144.1 putative major facilitator superfamily transporter [Nocardia brasiliensis NBRC 14402]SUB53300.1 Inner membrane transport protein YeaN [Nocardia brasiliensis]
MNSAVVDRDRTGSLPAAGLLIGIVLIGANLRAALTGVGALLPTIERETGLSSAGSGVLGALPLLIFAAVAPLVARIAGRGSARVLLFALLGLVAGVLLRSAAGLWCLFAGTAVLAVAITFGNVLLPSVLRASLPERRIGWATGAYVTAMTLAAAVSSGVSVPLSEHLPGGWRSALACWAVLAVAALLVWSGQQRGQVRAPAATAPAGIPWRSGLAWQVSVFMGLQSLGFYAIIAWLPSIVHDNGMSERAAGVLLFAFQLLGLLAVNLLPWLERRLGDQRLLAAGASALNAIGFLLLALAPRLALVSVLLIGLGAGVCLVLAMTFQSRRARDAAQAAALAGMAQTVGFAVAAVGPLLLGLLHTLTAGWALALLTLTAATLAQAVVGWGAGRDVRL